MTRTLEFPGPTGPLGVRLCGEGGLPVVFVHGNGADGSHWLWQQRHLPTCSAAVDLRGMGRSLEAGGPYTFETAADDVSAIVDALQFHRFVLAGHSFGGAVVGELAARHPERLAGLLYVDAAGSVSIAESEANAFLAQFDEGRFEAFRERWFEPILVHARPETREKVMATLRATPRVVLRDNLASTLRYDPAPAFERFRGPTFAVAAAHLAGAMALVTQRPGLERRVFENVSHWLMLDDPEGFNAELDRFLARCS